MNWKTFTTTAARNLPDREELSDGEASDEVRYIGPAMAGTVYRSVRAPAYYRVLPAEEVSAERRHELRQWFRSDTGSDTVRGTELRQGVLGNPGRPVCFVRYDVAGCDRPLSEWLDSDDLHGRLRQGISVLRAVPGWWQRWGMPLLPMPADIVCSAQGTVARLPFPCESPPPAASVFAEPQRALYLAPEVVRTRTPADWHGAAGAALDRYAAGILLLQCLFGALRGDDAEATLLAAAGNRTPEFRERSTALPLWLTRARSFEYAEQIVRQLLAPAPTLRNGRSMEVVADSLEACASRLRPDEAVRELRATGGVEKALELAQDVLLEEETYEMLLLAGQLAQEGGRPLEAVDHLERAVQLDPDRPEAFLVQFRTIASARAGGPDLRTVFQYRLDTAAQLDAKIWRDFHQLTPALQKEHEEDMAYFLLWRGEQNLGAYSSLLSFVQERLEDDKGAYMWWRFPLVLARAEALLRLRRLDEARAVLEDVKRRLQQVKQNRTVDPRQIHLYGVRLADLEAVLVDGESVRRQGAVP